MRNGHASPNSKTFSATASLTWRLRRWLTMSLDYTYTWYNSGVASAGAATVNQAALRLAAAF